MALKWERMVAPERGCVDKVIYRACENGEWRDLTSYKYFLTCKDSKWDTDKRDTTAVFKVEGVIEDPEKEPGRLVFTLSEKNTNLEPDTTYYCDIVKTDEDGTSNAERVFKGYFTMDGAPNNAQTGGNNE